MIDTYKYLDKIKGKNGYKKGSKMKKIFSRFLILVIFFLVNLIFIKGNSRYREFVYSKIYGSNLSFAKIKEFYNKYLGGVEALDGIVSDTKQVFNENLSFKSKMDYKDGVKLLLEDNYLVPVLEEGLVIFSGEKDGYGNVIIIGGANDVNIWYGNMANSQVKLYDYVEKGSLLGEVNDNTLYIVYEKDGEFLDYNEFIK